MLFFLEKWGVSDCENNVIPGKLICSKKNNYIAPGKRGILTDAIFSVRKIKCYKCNILVNRL